MVFQEKPGKIAAKAVATACQQAGPPPAAAPAAAAVSRTRANTSPYDTKGVAVGRSGCSCGAQKVRA
jgi:hypothetical protein